MIEKIAEVLKWTSILALCNKPKKNQNPKNKKKQKTINEYAVWKWTITKLF